MKKVHTKANGYFKGECLYSRTGWAWWQNPQPGDVCVVPSCTCIPCKPPNNACSGFSGTRPLQSESLLDQAALSSVVLKPLNR